MGSQYQWPACTAFVSAVPNSANTTIVIKKAINRDAKERLRHNVDSDELFVGNDHNKLVGEW